MIRGAGLYVETGRGHQKGTIFAFSPGADCRLARKWGKPPSIHYYCAFAQSSALGSCEQMSWTPSRGGSGRRRAIAFHSWLSDRLATAASDAWSVAIGMARDELRREFKAIANAATAEPS